MASFRRPWKLLVSIVARRPPLVVAELDSLQQQFRELQRNLERGYSRLSDYELRKSDLQSQCKGKAKMTEKEETKMLLATREVSDLEEKEEEIRDQLSALVLKRAQDERLSTEKGKFTRHADRDLFLCVGDMDGNWVLPEVELGASENFDKATRRVLDVHFDRREDVLCFSRTPVAVFTRPHSSNRIAMETQGEKVFLVHAEVTATDVQRRQENGTSTVWLTADELEAEVDASYIKQIKRCFPNRDLLPATKYVS